MKVKLKNVRLSFPALFTPDRFKPDDQPKYKATFLIPKGDPQMKEIEAAALAALNAKFPGKGVTMLRQISGNANKCCIRDGDLTEYDGYAGCISVTAKSKTRPLVIGQDRSPLTEQDGRPYAGCYVNASIEFFGYREGGLSATLRGVQFLRDGDAFSGSSPADVDEFEDESEIPSFLD